MENEFFNQVKNEVPEYGKSLGKVGKLRLIGIISRTRSSSYSQSRSNQRKSWHSRPWRRSIKLRCDRYAYNARSRTQRVNWTSTPVFSAELGKPSKGYCINHKI